MLGFLGGKRTESEIEIEGKLDFLLFFFLRGKRKEPRVEEGFELCLVFFEGRKERDESVREKLGSWVCQK